MWSREININLKRTHLLLGTCAALSTCTFHFLRNLHRLHFLYLMDLHFLLGSETRTHAKRLFKFKTKYAHGETRTTITKMYKRTLAMRIFLNETKKRLDQFDLFEFHLGAATNPNKNLQLHYLNNRQHTN